MAELATIAMIAGMAGTAVSAGAAYGQAKGNKKMAEQTADFNARQMEAAAGEARAAASRKAEARNAEMERVLSRGRAVAAASGAGTTEGEGYLDLVSDTAERGKYYSQLEIAAGENQAAGLKSKGAAERWQAAAKGKMYDAQATGALVKGAFDMASMGMKNSGSMSSSMDSTQLVDSTHDLNSGWYTETRAPKPRGRYYV